MWQIGAWGALLPAMLTLSPAHAVNTAGTLAQAHAVHTAGTLAQAHAVHTAGTLAQAHAVHSATVPAASTGYTHLGATTLGQWGLVKGELTVTDPAVRPGSFDFVAARFMAKQETSGGTRWLEAGWAEVGWDGSGRQRVYTYDTSSRRWAFYDQYPLLAGERIAIALASNGRPDVWSAMLWWRGAWYPLTTAVLPAGGLATMEEYVEVYRDPRRPAGPMAVPPVQVSNVKVAGPGVARPWTDREVPSYEGPTPSGYCVSRLQEWTSWQAGTC
jgi:hypothetical protein